MTDPRADLEVCGDSPAPRETVLAIGRRARGGAEQNSLTFAGMILMRKTFSIRLVMEGC